MTARAALWAAGLAASALAHAGAGAVLWAAVRPEPVAEQPSPETRLDMQAMQLDRTRARPAEAQPQNAPEAGTTGTALAPGAIAQSRARPARPRASALAPAPAPTQAARPGAAPAPRLTAQSPNPDALTARPAPAATLASHPARAQSAPTTRPAAQPLAQAAAPVQSAALAPANAVPAPALRPGAQPLILAALPSAPLPPSAPRPAPAESTTPQGPRAPASAPQGAPAPASAPQGAPAPASAPQGARIKAALAFPGGAAGVDPVSLAAFQSFMQPGDAASGAERLRDGLAGLLAQVPCSRLQLSFEPETATLQVKGHIPENGLRGPVLAALRDQMGADIGVSDNILLLPRPQCGALSGIADVGLPQSTDQITNPRLIGVSTHARVLDFARGDRLWFDLTAPDYAAYVYVDYFDAGGNVIHLAPNDQSPLHRAEAKSALRVGAREAGAAGLQIIVGPPYGQEIAVAFTASAPLYDGLRPLFEPAAPYLDWLKSRVAAARQADPDFKGEWVYFFVTTADR